VHELASTHALRPYEWLVAFKESGHDKRFVTRSAFSVYIPIGIEMVKTLKT
jgi:hypothetical protein